MSPSPSLKQVSPKLRDRPLFFPGGIVIFRRQEIFFYHRLSACKFIFLHSLCRNFFKIPQISHHMGGLYRQFFSDARLVQTIYFSNFSYADNFFPSCDTPPPPRGKNNGPSLMIFQKRPVKFILKALMLVKNNDFMQIFDCKIFNFSRAGMSFSKYFSTTGSTMNVPLHISTVTPRIGYFHDFLPDFNETKVPKMKLSPLHLGLILKCDSYPFLIHSKLIKKSLLYFIC